jgi:formamidopyrimidine-DNA glycosylase
MPELVEVEAARRLCERIVGKTVTRAWIKPDEDKVFKFPCGNLASDIASLQVKPGKAPTRGASEE